MKRVIVTLIVLALLGTGIYYFLTKERETMPTCEAGFRLDFASRTCVPVVSDENDNEVDFAASEVTVPDSDLKVKLVREGDGSKYSGTFEDTRDGTMRGYVWIDSSQSRPIGENMMLAPLYVAYGGTGQFLYVALFDTKSNEHLGSAFVGDRLLISSIETKDNVAKVNYKARLVTEAMASEPTIPAQIAVDVSGRTLKVLMRLQNADYNDIEVKSPTAGSVLSGDFTLKGSMPGTWYFEANAHFRVVDKNLNQIAIGSIQALSDWMTTQRVPFEVKMNTSSFGYLGDATIVIESDNVQGDEEGARKQKRMEIPLLIR